MKVGRTIILILIAFITLAILFAYYNPDFLEDTWLWLVGLSGTIIVYIREIVKIIKRFILKFNADGNK